MEYENDGILEVETVAAGLVEICRECESEEDAIEVMMAAVTIAMEWWGVFRGPENFVEPPFVSDEIFNMEEME